MIGWAFDHKLQAEARDFLGLGLHPGTGDACCHVSPIRSERIRTVGKHGQILLMGIWIAWIGGVAAFLLAFFGLAFALAFCPGPGRCCFLARVVIEQQGNLPSRSAAGPNYLSFSDSSSEPNAGQPAKDTGTGHGATSDSEHGGSDSRQPGTAGGANSGDLHDRTVSQTIAEHVLPPLEIHHTGFWEGVENVASELGHGAWTEITEHPGRVAADAAIGFGVGLGMTMVAPVVALGAGLAMGGVAAYEVATHAQKWYHDASVVARPEGHDWMEVSNAKEGVQSFGGGAVDVAAGLAGGIAGAKFGQSELFAAIKGTAKEIVGEFVNQSYFDGEGRPLKLPLPNKNGSAFLSYDKNGQLSSIRQTPANGGWLTFMERQTDSKGVSAWMIHGESADGDLVTAPEVYQGTVSLAEGNRALVLDGPTGTQTMSADLPSQWTQTAEQLKLSREWAADLSKRAAALRAQDGAGGGNAVGAGASAIGLGMIMH